jgi:hypothetical protein
MRRSTVNGVFAIIITLLVLEIHLVWRLRHSAPPGAAERDFT